VFAPPSLAQIQEAGAALGLHLSDADASLLRTYLTDQLSMLDSFLQSRIDDDPPPLQYPQRAPGFRPTDGDDPYRAWMWRCDIGGADDGLLAGKTVSFKDHIAVAGIPLAFGTSALRDFVPDFDASVVTRALAAGARVTGKNTHHGLSGLRSVGGALGDFWDAVNPHDQARQAGGSSSGCAVAVAVGDVDIAFGGDQGGSVRQPAAYCGVVGLKPTYGLVSHFGAYYAGEPTIDHIGPIARSVEDVALALQAVAGYDGRDPRQGRDVPGSVDALGSLSAGVDGLIVGVLSEGFDEPIDPQVREGVLAAIDVLRAAGAKIVSISVPEHRSVLGPAGVLQLEGFRAARVSGPAGAGHAGYYPGSVITALNRAWQQQADQMAGYLKLGWLAGELSQRAFHGAAYAKAQNVRPHFARAYGAALRDVDVLALPACPNVAPERSAPLPYLAAWVREVEVLGELLPSYRNLAPFNYTGHPALAVPCGTVDGLPISLQLVGRHHDDPLLLRAGYAYQQSAAKPATPAGPGRTTS
jgi:amidase